MDEKNFIFFYFSTLFNYKNILNAGEKWDFGY